MLTPAAGSPLPTCDAGKYMTCAEIGRKPWWIIGLWWRDKISGDRRKKPASIFENRLSFSSPTINEPLYASGMQRAILSRFGPGKKGRFSTVRAAGPGEKS